jgi:predicted nicotinamide N-methyase
MPSGRKPYKKKQERQVFGITMLHPGHPEVQRLRCETPQPSLHGQKVWRSSFLLMDYLQQRGLQPGARVLELGCGWGLVGIYCAKTFQADVTGLDADAAVFPYLQLHARLNGVDIRTRQLTFEHANTLDLAVFDVIIGSDICFWDELVNPLYDLVRRSITAGVAQILLADPGRPPFDELCACCKKEGGVEVIDWQVPRPCSASGLILRTETSGQAAGG